MTLTDELMVLMGYRDRYPVVTATTADGLYREVVLARLSALLDRPVLRDGADGPVVEIADERYRADADTMRRAHWLTLIASALYPSESECGQGRPFHARAHKGSDNRVARALDWGAHRLADEAAERIKADVIARLEAMR